MPEPATAPAFSPNLHAARRPHLLHVLPTFAVGGIEMRLARVVNEIGPCYRHSVVALNGRLDCLEHIAPGVDVSAYPIQLTSKNPLAVIPRCRRELAQRRPDLLLTYNFGAIEWAMANRLFPFCPHIHFEDGFGPEETEARFPRRIILRRLALGRTLKIVVPSQTLARIVRSEWRFEPDRVLYLPNGIDVDAFLATADDTPVFARRADEIIVGTVARLHRVKNIGRLIRAVARCRNERIRLVIAGDGSERDVLEREARELLGDRALFLGTVPRPMRILKSLDIFCISSDSEQMPLNLLEATAAALPVAAVAVGDVALMTAEENRPFIVPRDDEEALATAISRLARDGALRARLGRLNQRHVRATFPWRRMIEGYEQLFALAAKPC